MRILQERLTALMAVLFLALALTQAESPAAIIASVAVVALVAVMAGLVVGSRELTVGSRARAHRDALTAQPAPAHPSTAGRPRTRAPSTGILAA
ncbi:hypothetical protein BH09ACT5_BH09ACT5_20950 [soil metagenome]